MQIYAEDLKSLLTRLSTDSVDKFKDKLMTKKVHWNDLHEGTSKELRRTYKMNAKELEKAIRYHLDGATQPERRKLYEEVYGKR